MDTMRNVVFDFGNVVIEWQPYRALHHLFTDKAEMESTLAEIGFYKWNFEQESGQSREEGFSDIERDMPEHAHIFREYVKGLEVAHSTLIPGTSELIGALHANGIGLYGLANATSDGFSAVKRAAPVIELMRDVVISADVGTAKPQKAIYEIKTEFRERY